MNRNYRKNSFLVFFVYVELHFWTWIMFLLSCYMYCKKLVMLSINTGLSSGTKGEVLIQMKCM